MRNRILTGGLMLLLGCSPGDVGECAGEKGLTGGAVGDGGAVTRAARDLLEGRPAELSGDGDACRAAVLSLSREAAPALVAEGRGRGLAAALGAAAAELRNRAGAGEIAAGRLKVDVLTSSVPGAFTTRGRARLDRSLRGLWLPEPDLLLLPAELLGRNLLDSDGDLRSDRLRRYLAEGGRRPTPLPEDPARAGAAFRALRFASFAEGEGGEAVELFRGNPLHPDLSPPALLAAARAGGEYLLRHQKADGSFGYSYYAKTDSYRDKTYNLLRHAGTCYALFELYGATGEERFLRAGERGLDFLETTLREPRPEDRSGDGEENFLAVLSPGREAKLGGAALAALAMLERQRQTGERDRLARVRRLARFLLFMQDGDGHFRSKYFYGEPDPKPFESIYYPGEAILALARLARVEPRGPWLEAAEGGARWLIEVRDRNKGAADLPHDHWLLMALEELYDLSGGDGLYLLHARRIASAILLAQRRPSHADHPDWVGTFYDPPRSTPTATRAEALVAMHRLAAQAGDDPAPYLEALRPMAAFQRRCQLTPISALYLPRPDRARGGFRRSLTHWEVRIDYVQHNLSALLGLRRILIAEAL